MKHNSGSGGVPKGGVNSISNPNLGGDEDLVKLDRL